MPYTEWGGHDVDGTTFAFDTRRPGWYKPVHELLVENRVTAFFHGHDHEFAHEERDGVVYQLVPMAAGGYDFGSFQLYSEADPYTIRVLPNSGHLRLTVGPSTATVDYVRAFLPGDGPNGQVAYTYTMTGTDTRSPVISAVSSSMVDNQTAAVVWTTDEASDSRVDYGTSQALGLSVSDPTLGDTHSVTLTSLLPGTIYYYRVTSRDAAGNIATWPASSLGTFTTPAGRFAAFPVSTVIEWGTPRGGGAASLTEDDNVYFEVKSVPWRASRSHGGALRAVDNRRILELSRRGTRTTSSTATFVSVPNDLSDLRVTYKGKSSHSCLQAMSIWNSTASRWVLLDFRSVGTKESLIADLRPPGALADFVSGDASAGELRLHVQCSRQSDFVSSWDLLRIDYVSP